MTNMPDTGREDGSDYTTLLRNYGQALVRISELEEELVRFSVTCDAQVAQPSGTESEENMCDSDEEHIAEQLGGLQQHVVSGESNFPKSGSASATITSDNVEINVPEDPIQLRLQVTSLSNQLALVQHELEGRQEKRVSKRRSSSRSSKGRRHRWWQFWHQGGI